MWTKKTLDFSVCWCFINAFHKFQTTLQILKKCARVHFIAHKTFTKPFKKKKKILNHCMNCLYSCLLAGRLLHCLCWHIVTQNVRNDKMLLVPVMHIHLHNTNTTGTVKSGQKPHRVPLSDAKNRSVTETFKSKNRPLNLWSHGCLQESMEKTPSCVSFVLYSLL